MPPPRREWKLRVGDIRRAIEKVLDHTEGMSYEEFSQDEWLMDAVAHNLLIMGEAAKHIPHNVRSKVPDIPWNSMKYLRNIIAHEYFTVSRETLWKTVNERLPKLLEKLRESFPYEKGSR